MAEVWMGRRQAMGGANKAVAIKLLASHLAENPVYRRMFVDEARLTMMLTHSNIVQVFDVGEQSGRSYLVMEWVDGLDLAQLASVLREASEPLPFAVIGHVIGEVLRGLSYAHGLTEGEASSAIVHRDISPHNVLISVSGEVKISDFGVARLASEETSGLHVRGKLRYMPPEQIRGESKYPTIDLFAVGAILQELLDGVRFRAGLERDALFGMVINGEVPPLSREGVPAELVALRDGLLERDHEARIQTAQEALTLLRRWPGYRNAADELGAIVRSGAGVEAPRSGLAVAFSNEELEILDEPTVHEGAAQRSASDLDTRTVPSDDHGQVSDTTPSFADEHDDLQAIAGTLGARRWTVVLGVGIATIGIGLGIGLSGLGDSSREPSEAAPQAIVVAAPAVAGDPSLAPEPEASIEPPPPDLPASAKPTTKPKPTPRPKPKAVGPAKVEFAAHEFFFVWVKVDGREHALEPVAKLSLAPGKHQVYLRESKEQPWRKAGRIDIDGGRRYRVSLRKPASVSVERLD